MNPNWHRAAACADADDPELWFPVGEGARAQQQTEDAQAICRTCPVIEQCLSWALETRQDAGIWGGATVQDRRRIHRRRTRTAPVRTVADVFADLTRPTGTDGHLIWTGHPNTTINKMSYSPNRLAWAATRDTEPVGLISRYCDVQGCVAHLEDQPARTARLDAERPNPADLAPDSKCGTQWGYRLHLTRGEPTCAHCRAAHSAAKRHSTTAA